MAKFDFEKYIVPFGLLAGAYYILTKFVTPRSTGVTDKCPRGRCYTRDTFQNCDDNYISNLFGWTCYCLDANPPCDGAPKVGFYGESGGYSIVGFSRFGSPDLNQSHFGF